MPTPGGAPATVGVAHTTICRERISTTTEREALVEERREDREVLGPLDQRGLHRGAQGVAIEQIDVPHRRRRVEHLTERDVDSAVSQCGEQAKQHREDAIACGVSPLAEPHVDLGDGLEQRLQDRAPELLEADSSGVGRHVDRGDRATGPISQRCRDGPHAVFELLVDQRPPLRAHLADQPEEPRRIGLGVLSTLLDRHRDEPRVQLVVGQIGEQHAAHRRDRRRQARAERQRDRHDPLRGDARDVHDLVAVEHRCRHRLVATLRQRLHVGLHEVGELARRDVRVPEVEDEWRELEQTPVVAHVPEALEREEETPRRRAGEAGESGDLREREGGMLRGEAPQHREASFERLHEVVVALHRGLDIGAGDRLR